MGSPSYMRSVIDQNIVMWCMTIYIKFKYVAVSCITQPSRPHTALGLDIPDVDCHTTQTAQHHKPEGHDLHLQHCDKLKLHVETISSSYLIKMLLCSSLSKINWSIHQTNRVE